MFKLSKWYLDCVTERGDTSIAYTGEVVWGKVRLHYTSLLESKEDRVTTRQSLRKQNQPEFTGDALNWHAKKWDIDGEWRAHARTSNSGFRKTILSSGLGFVEWHCVVPLASVRIGSRIGLGYAEHLCMTIPPWKLPIRTLRWGRFTSDSDWIVWLDWQGEFSHRFVCKNGKTVPDPQIEDGSIELENGARLEMDRALVLRDGPLGTTALSGIPGIAKTFPARLLQVNECKWRSRARLQQPGTPAIEGWAIHERVDWPE